MRFALCYYRSVASIHSFAAHCGDIFCLVADDRLTHKLWIVGTVLLELKNDIFGLVRTH